MEYVLRIEYRLIGEKKSKVEYRDYDELEEALDMRDKWIKIFRHNCVMFDAGIYEMTNY